MSSVCITLECHPYHYFFRRDGKSFDPYHYICDINPVLFPAEYNQQNHILATNVAKDGSLRNSGTIGLPHLA